MAGFDQDDFEAFQMAIEFWIILIHSQLFWVLNFPGSRDKRDGRWSCMLCHYLWNVFHIWESGGTIGFRFMKLAKMHWSTGRFPLTSGRCPVEACELLAFALAAPDQVRASAKPSRIEAMETSETNLGLFKLLKFSCSQIQSYDSWYSTRNSKNPGMVKWISEIWRIFCFVSHWICYPRFFVSWKKPQETGGLWGCWQEAAAERQMATSKGRASEKRRKITKFSSISKAFVQLG